MARLPRLLLGIAAVIAGLVAAAFLAFWVMMVWHMRPRHYDPRDRDFHAAAIEPLSKLACGSVPEGLAITRYFEQRNFNDGDELWRLESGSPDALASLAARLQLERVSTEQVPRFASNLDNKPDWVTRPRSDMRWLFVDADTRTGDPARRTCKHGIFYLWSIDGKTFFLYHIVT